ncbi:MAG: cytochrome-c peroxidase [Alteromonas sp. Nap_26]|nr:MAG: cytochrome-c peroxidase [Alteromonas sp. Nap_26]
MIGPIIQFSLIQRLFVLCVFIVLLAFGFRAWQTLPVDAFPDISPTQVKLVMKADGMTAEEIEAQITQPIEVELLGIPHQTVLRSTTKYAITSITLDFEEGTDIYWARQQVSARLSSIMSTLPDVVEGGIAPMSTPLSEMFMFTIENPSLSLQERKHILDWQIRPMLRTVPGVADVNVLGGFTRTFQFSPDMQKLRAVGLSLDTLSNALLEANLNGSVGRINAGVDSLIIRTESRATSIEDLGKVVVGSYLGTPVLLNEIGKLSMGSLTRYGGVTRNGEETTQALIVALKNSNTAEVVSQVTQKLDEIIPTLPQGTSLNVFYNRKSLIDTAVGTITSALGQAIIIVVLVLALFLGNLRASLVVALVIPVVVLLTFLAMKATGLTANLMSLGGVVIAIGMLVDASVVVVENTVTHLSKHQPLPRLHLIYRATRAVAVPVVAGTIIVIVVFVPLLTLTGLEGKLFSPVAMTIVYAMVASLVTAFTLVPVATSFLLTSNQSATPRYLARMQEGYRYSLNKVLAYAKLTVICVLGVLMLSGVLFLDVGKTFMPVMDEGDIIVQLEKSPTISLSSSLAIDKQVETALLSEFPEIKQIVARTGSDELGLDPMGLNETDVFMQLAPIEQWRYNSKQALEAAIRDYLTGFPGINIGFTQPIQMRVSEMLTGTTGMVAIKVFGNDMETLSTTAQQIAEVVREQAGAVDVNTTLIEGGDFLSIVPKPGIALDFGMSTAALSRYLKMQVSGMKIGEVIQSHIRTPIFLGSLEQGTSQLTSPEALNNLMILMPDGSQLPLRSIADVKLSKGPAVIERQKAQRFAVVTSNVDGRDLVGFVDEVRSAVAQKVSLPTGYFLEYGGEFENQIRATNNLITVIPIVIVAIVLILFSIFGTWSLALLILANVPFAMMGGVLALYITGEYLSVPASVGFIALLGIAVLNGVVMVSHFEGLKQKRMALTNIVKEGAASRLRPILMTATTAMFGLLPLAFASGPGAEIQKPLAIVVIGGLITSTLITLYLLPIGYYYLERRKNG